MDGQYWGAKERIHSERDVVSSDEGTLTHVLIGATSKHRDVSIQDAVTWTTPVTRETADLIAERTWMATSASLRCQRDGVRSPGIIKEGASRGRSFP
jgi:hypothetical protein